MLGYDAVAVVAHVPQRGHVRSRANRGADALRESLDAFFDKAGESTTGEVTLRLYKGGIQPVSRKSPYSLYSLDIASFTMGASYDQKDALGFINLIGLPIKVRAALQGKAK